MLIRTQATRLLGHAGQGQTLPLILECRSGSSAPEIIQVKVAGKRNGLTAKELSYEILLTTLARSCGIHVSTPTLVTLNPELVADIESRYEMGIRETFGAGVVWLSFLRPYIPVLSPTWSSDKAEATWRKLCGRLVAFDLLVVNSDRTPANPNLAWEPGDWPGMPDRLLAFDFEHCLELPNRGHREMLETHQSLLPNLRSAHVLRKFTDTKSIKAELAYCFDTIEADESIDRTAELLPVSGRGHFLNAIAYLRFLSQNRGVIIDAIAAK